MKKAILLLVTIFVLSNCFAHATAVTTAGADSVNYGSCQVVTSGSPCFFGLYAFWIQTVSFGTLNFTGGTCSGDGTDDGYQNLYDVDSGTVTAGNTYTFTMSRPTSFFGNNGGFFSAWVDWNNDGSWTDAGDLLFTVTGSDGGLTQSFSVTVPATATNGEHRLRVRSDQADPGGNPNACATTGSYGDTKDFQIDVVGGRTAACLVTIHTPFDNGAHPTCLYGCSATISASPLGVAPFSYAWATLADTDSVIYNACAGTYSVTVTDSNGCIATATATISQPDSMSVTAVVTPIHYICDSLVYGGVTITGINGGPGGTNTYLWANGETTENLDSISTPGRICFAITDSKGCVMDTCFVVPLLNLPLQLSLTSQNPSSNGSDDGTITAHATGGKRPYSFVWSPSISSDSTATGLDAGGYLICVVDSNGCIVCDTVTLAAPCSVMIHTPWDNGAHPACLYGCSATLTATATGAAPFSYSWSLVADTDTVVYNACAGSYSVTMTDNNGCSAAYSVTISQPDSMSVTAVVKQITFHCDTALEAYIHITSIQGGDAPYSYLWSPGGQTTQNLDSIGPGQYCLEITDSAGCTMDTCFTIFAPPPPLVFAVELTGHNPTCVGCADGSITATPLGGVRPYTYTWTPSVSTDSVATGLTAGSYMVCVTDSNGCQACDTITLSMPLLVKEFATGAFSISPNPVRDELTVVSPALHEGAFTMDMYNVLGQKTYPLATMQKRGECVLVDVSELPAGIYFIQITTGTERCMQKFVKE